MLKSILNIQSHAIQYQYQMSKYQTSLVPPNGGRQTGGRQTRKIQKSQKSKIPKNLKNHPQNQKDTIKKIKANKYET